MGFGAFVAELGDAVGTCAFDLFDELVLDVYEDDFEAGLVEEFGCVIKSISVLSSQW